MARGSRFFMAWGSRGDGLKVERRCGIWGGEILERMLDRCDARWFTALTELACAADFERAGPV